MDARAYLQRQGWRGDGHSLDYSNRGIKKPLLVSKKIDVLGVGLNKHAAVSDQWWLRAFDEGLKNFGTGVESTLATVQKHGVNRGGLYARFVRGEGLQGTIEERKVELMAVKIDSNESSSEDVRVREKKRKRKSRGEDGASAEERSKKASAKESAKKSQARVDSAVSSEVESGRYEDISAAKLKEYKKRAEEKGISLDEYIKRRAEKFTAKQKEKRQRKEKG